MDWITWVCNGLHPSPGHPPLSSMELLRASAPPYSEGGGPWTSSRGIPWELVGSQMLRAHPDLLKQKLHSNQTPG